MSPRTPEINLGVGFYGRVPRLEDGLRFWPQAHGFSCEVDLVHARHVKVIQNHVRLSLPPRSNASLSEVSVSTLLPALWCRTRCRKTIGAKVSPSTMRLRGVDMRCFLWVGLAVQ